MTPIPSTAFADAWIQVDRTEDPRFFVNLLDATRARLLERARESPKEFFASLDLRPGLNVLDVGCGTGDFLRLLAPLVAPGSAVGLDLSETMISEARQRSDHSTSNLLFGMGSVLDLPFDNGSFDRVIATQLLVHVPDASRGLAEMRRMLSPGGMISLTEIDWGTLVVESTNRELGQRLTDLACKGLRNALKPRIESGSYAAADHGSGEHEYIRQHRISEQRFGLCGDSYVFGADSNAAHRWS